MIVAIYPLVAVKQNFKIGREAAVNPHLTYHGKINKWINPHKTNEEKHGRFSRTNQPK